MRAAPVKNKFRYPVRMAVIDLDDAPSWFKSSQSADHLTADEARRYAGTEGPVSLLTNPVTAGYSQNPISVYYCRNKDLTLKVCIAEVTNTPWNERVTFLFKPEGERVKKSLHVSPFMDMMGTWIVQAPDPSESTVLRLSVDVEHPEYGMNFFHADLVAVRSAQAGVKNEAGGFKLLWRYGFQPHRVAIWIYWQALILIYKGLPLHGLPSRATKQAAEVNASHPRDSIHGHLFTWRRPRRWPWSAAYESAILPTDDRPSAVDEGPSVSLGGGNAALSSCAPNTCSGQGGFMSNQGSPIKTGKGFSCCPVNL
ncbi:hypothetical protein CEUSTIGMA_g12353.t1 [Chlamydomonas eustigma]|uniref:DUF1365 domain-containing protein n=1 Tax=Chlamydomonas eustigma TaxID=1157962 RepID=A0A250XPS9_9CHLO|nr:hypothetical protein CEUSTIGMA_g12353.t1 [Chlamydomonas eustigma]|eukprot:GAX84932.1 hypothetical protein CEUSTIGMA_g12353.t1 [Chlamydomonas eustigma]